MSERERAGERESEKEGETDGRLSAHREEQSQPCRPRRSLAAQFSSVQFSTNSFAVARVSRLRAYVLSEVSVHSRCVSRYLRYVGATTRAFSLVRLLSRLRTLVSQCFDTSLRSVSLRVSPSCRERVTRERGGRRPRVFRVNRVAEECVVPRRDRSAVSFPSDKSDGEGGVCVISA